MQMRQNGVSPKHDIVSQLYRKIPSYAKPVPCSTAFVLYLYVRDMWK